VVPDVFDDVAGAVETEHADVRRVRQDRSRLAHADDLVVECVGVDNDRQDERQMGVGKPAVTIGSADRVLRSRQMSTLHAARIGDLSSHGVRSQIIERCHVIKSRSGRRQ